MAIFLLGPDPQGQCCDCANRINPCDSCGPRECLCSLNVNDFIVLTQFTTYSETLAYLTGPNVSNGIGVLNGTSDSIVSFTSSNAVKNRLEILANVRLTRQNTTYFCVSVPTNTTLTISFQNQLSPPVAEQGSVDSVLPRMGVVVTECATGAETTFVAYTTSGTGSIVLTSTGIYYLRVTVEYAVPIGTVIQPLTFINANVTITAPTLVVNPVIAQWQDGANIRYLEARPRLQIPTFGNTLFSSASTAQSAIDTKGSNCIGYFTTSVNPLEFSASYGSGAISIHAKAEAATIFGQPAAGGQFAILASTVGVVNITFSVQVGFSLNPLNRRANASAAIADLYGNQLQIVSAQGNPGTELEIPALNGSFSLTIPYPGKFYITCSSFASGGNGITPNDITGDFVATPVATFTMCNIEALYSVGVNCGETLECGL